jgi:hypothetical protein
MGTTQHDTRHTARHNKRQRDTRPIKRMRYEHNGQASLVKTACKQAREIEHIYNVKSGA